MRFADIPGLIEVKEDLFRNAESGRVAHAQLFMGKPGSANLAPLSTKISNIFC